VGLILDSTDLIVAERSGANARYAIEAIQRQVPNEQIGISVISLMELAHGVARARNQAQAEVRRQFIRDLQSSLPVYAVSDVIALRAGELDGQLAIQNIHLALSDLLIGVTALTLGYRIATRNVRHFRLIPGLVVITL
jgi:tRNA(fMet)-specific endonuclease VapC